ncbi:hypothetical protein BGW36DRAFT_389124 [Talaromyces proteolyticus]|uniref:C2H2-type domain-containing protein n=1 Tax=Talaromyces proteolyticus TaxID=1131652 RepID=A0AAD4KFS8_9EURO|nr:uncharacterized protein BGW36DRAFT_389124 [Talaromyces proteolyticus]KAH8690656.1 hypothetical protein BGW36DRAFT_389124 [Talaromyces proteolyticus]
MNPGPASHIFHTPAEDVVDFAAHATCGEPQLAVMDEENQGAYLFPDSADLDAINQCGMLRDDNNFAQFDLLAPSLLHSFVDQGVDAEWSDLKSTLDSPQDDLFWIPQPSIESGDITSDLDGSSLLVSDVEIAHVSPNLPTRSFAETTKLSRDKIRVLRDWRIMHGEMSRPSGLEMQRLQSITQLSAEQINNWFLHSKRRNVGVSALRRGTAGTSLQSSQISAARDIPERPLTPSVKNLFRSDPSLDDMCPMERWKNSPPEHEAALVSDIAKALSHPDLPFFPEESQTSTRSPSRGDSVSTRSSFNGIFPDPSISSVDSDLLGSTAWSDHSGQSTHSGKSSTEYRRRSRKRRTNYLSRGGNSLRGDAPKTFQCTFCTDSFKTKYDWSRHEKSLHLALESWTCSPFGSIVVDDTESASKCAYCNASSPTEDHLQTHRHMACHGRPEPERTYYRKDHLRQHLRLVHGCKFISTMENWKRTPEYVQSRCGFCDEVLTTWKARTEHLARHFRSGASMSDWSGGWGFEPHIARLIENSMPPYLIHHERSTIVPFSGSKTLSNRNQADEGTPEVYSHQMTYPASRDIPLYHCFELQIRNYINSCIAEGGKMPSDSEIQGYGRSMVYGEDDPWHQTIADNAAWLKEFRERYGYNNDNDCSSPLGADT